MQRDLDVLPCGLLQTLDDGTIRHANRTFCAWLDTSCEALVGRRFQDLLTMGGKIFHHTHWAPLLRMQGSIAEVKLELVHGDAVIPVVINAIRRDDAGVIVHEIAAYVARDRDRYEQELVRARRRLEDLVAELGQLHAAAKQRAAYAEQLVGIVSHDLRNPLNAIQMGVDLLDLSPLSDEDRRILARIDRATHRATHLIGDLLDFTRARVGNGLSVSPAPLALHDVVAEALDDHRLAHPDRVLVHLREGDGPSTGDTARIVQLLGNLVSNAIAYGARGSPITVSTICGAATGASSVLIVHNHGPAIPTELQAMMFEPMTRGDQAGSGRSVGLGLFIVREIARAHGGSVSVASTAQAGTAFRVEW